MKNFGLSLLFGGIIGFFLCSSQMSAYDPVPEGKSISESLQYPAGKWELGRYLSGGAAAFGLLLAAFAPKGR